MSHSAHDLWVSLSTTPLLWLVVTLGAYLVGTRVRRAAGDTPLVNPVLVAIALVGGLLLLTGTSYAAYFSGAKFIHFLLGPATVALAIPLADNIHHVRRSLVEMGAALLAGCLVSMLSGIALVLLLGGPAQVALSMAPKAVTTPIAMAVASEIGGLPALTAVLAILGGIIAAVLGEGLLRATGISDWRAHGLAAGLAGSGIAAAQVAGRDPLAAAFSALGIGLNGLLTALAAPAAVALLHRLHWLGM